MRYDSKNKKKGKKTHLFLTYSSLATLLGLLIFMVVDCKIDGKLSDKVNKDINDTSTKISTGSTRTIERSIIELETEPIEIISEPEIIDEPVEEIVTEPELIEEKPIVTEGEVIEIDEEYTIQRKVRN